MTAVKAPVTQAGIIFVANGAGDFQAASQNIRKVIHEDLIPMQVVTVPWSHGYGRILADQVGYQHIRTEGAMLAGVVQQFRAENPGVAVYLMGHSAGAAVIVAALENLPPEAVERSFLLAPSLSADYDIRPALKAVQQGLHVFYSHRDTAYLGVWTGILGNSDRHWGPSSGHIGFQVSSGTAEDAVLWPKFYQRGWEPSDRATGNDGKHYGDYQPNFVRSQIVPFLGARSAGSRPLAVGERLNCLYICTFI